jgi:DNA-binding transcriptional LysR family regulator
MFSSLFGVRRAAEDAGKRRETETAFCSDLPSTVVDSSTRRLRSFQVLADELHFGRAARRLFVTQQALSKQIATLESELGIALVNRTSRTVALTEAGERFLAACRDTLEAFDAGVADTRRIASAVPVVLRLGFFVLAALELTTPILNAFAARHPTVRVELQEYSFLDPSAGLAGGASDVAIVRLPIGTPGLMTEPLFVEPRVAALAVDHPLAARATVAVDDLLDEPMTVGIGGDAVYRAFWTLSEHRRAPAPEPIETRSHAQELELVATGRAFSVTSACAARFTPHPGVAFVAIDGVDGAVCALAWQADAETDLVRRFVAVARETRDAEHELIERIEHPPL